MKPRIGLISYGDDRPAYGISRYTLELRAALNDSKVPLTVLYAGRAGLQNGSVRLLGSGRAPGLLTLGQAEISWSAWRRNLALIHDPTGIAPLLLTRAKRVATIHDVIPYIYPETSTALNRLLYRYWLPVVVKRLHRIITVSYQSKTDIVRYLRVSPDRVSVVPHGVDQRFRPAEREEIGAVLKRYGITSPYILYVSAVEPKKKRKNLPRLLEAYAEFRGWSDRWNLVVAGPIRRDFRSIFDMVERLTLQPHVHFTDFVSDEDLPALYSGADAFVFPSLYEGFGFPILEAMACGTPVITSNASSLPEVSGDAAMLVDPHSSTMIADAMRELLSTPDLATKLSKKGLVRAQQFRWECTARETIAVYERVLGRQIR